jgi:predicted PurR-regulated permease PerM
MSIYPLNQKIPLIAFLTGIVWVLYSLNQLLIPFVLGLILAYAFHAPNEYISRKCRVSSSISAFLIVFFIISLFCFFVVFIIPFIKNDALFLMKKLPIIIEKLPEAVNASMSTIAQHLGIEVISIDLQETLAKYLNQFATTFPEYIRGFLNTSITLMYGVMFLFMTPIITFYLLKDWSKIKDYTFVLLQRFFSEKIIILLHRIDKNLGQYIIGQLCICVVLSIVYSIALWGIGVSPCIICGMFAGIMSLIPFLGALISFITTITVAIDHYSILSQYVLTGVLFVTIPFIDANFITPRLIGKKIHIQPFWILFSICATVSILGIPGMFIAVPTSIVFSTICKFVVNDLPHNKQ